MAYDYVKKTYGVEPAIGSTVKHTVTGNMGVVARENKSQGHYVQVRFIGRKHAVPCHPEELDYSVIQ